MGRHLARAASGLAVAALFASTATASFAAPAGGGDSPVPIDAPDGHYIVVLKDSPLAGYEGGTAGIPATKPADGEQLDATTTTSRKYIAHLANEQRKLAKAVGADIDASYQVTLNGFAADLTAAAVGKLRADKTVLGVYADEMRHPDATPSTEFLGLGTFASNGTDGVWEETGGVSTAGEGIVVGVVDTGISPDNPSFAGDPLTTRKNKVASGANAPTDPYLVGNDIVYHKSDGNLFVSERVTGEGWQKSDYSTKLIGAQNFDSGAKAAKFKFQYDYMSPRDGAGHGSHTASTAAGNFGVEASVGGVDFGMISGVAPAAKVAAYKACYDGPDPLDTEDDICALSDLLDAIDQAVEDGVDVINYSIGGGAATTVLGPDDISFFYAAVAGVFVSTSAGNSGPGYSTADHASPWYMTVAASTIPTYEGTVELPTGSEFVGASVTVPFGESITGDVVYSGDIPAAGASADDAALCYLGSIDPAAAEGKIVVCDRGTIARVEKSQTVAEAGGMGMVLVNVTPGSLDNDFHSVPTVHIQSTYRAELLDYVRNTENPTITLWGDNITDQVTATPQIAGFSSRGPMLAAGSDVLKPDVTAPGVAILAATNNGPHEAPTFGFLSGTSMSSPHVAGLGALYLGEHPTASPSEVKSALMTTAYDSVNADGSANTDPFAQGAGHVDPTKYLAPGLLYLNGPYDWAQYLQGQELVDFEVDPIDASDLNLASIAIGSLAAPQTVTRTVTATQTGTFTASIDVPGIDAVVSPSTLTFDEVGDSKTFTVTFTKTDAAAAEKWTSGFLTWTSGSTEVRSPIAIYPVTAAAPAEVSGTGADGSTEVTITPGVNGSLPLNLAGLAPVETIGTGTESGGSRYFVTVESGTELARFALDSSDDAGSDLDLFVYRVVSTEDPIRYYEMWQSASASADEMVTIVEPTAGTYMIETDVYSSTGPLTWDATSALVKGVGDGALAANPNPLPVTAGVETTFDVSWSGLGAGGYLGVVRYGESAVRTVVSVDVP